MVYIPKSDHQFQVDMALVLSRLSENLRKMRFITNDRGKSLSDTDLCVSFDNDSMYGFIKGLLNTIDLFYLLILEARNDIATLMEAGGFRLINFDVGISIKDITCGFHCAQHLSFKDAF